MIGKLLFLPDMNFLPDNFITDQKKWSKAAQQFAGKFVSEIVQVDKQLRKRADSTPEPDWAKAPDLQLKEELVLLDELNVLEAELSELERKKNIQKEKLLQIGKLRSLLFEKGKPLEYAILDALQTLGFQVTQFNSDGSEFDAVFSHGEDRYIGEAEGRDTKPISIDKFRQLALNIHEDLKREEILVPAKPVLFGNAFRLRPLSEREEPFTEKCLASAKLNSTCLVSTPDLFFVAQYLKSRSDKRFAERCRKTIRNTIGLASFPPIPVVEAAKGEDSVKTEDS
jgi:hypothetical protein